MWCVFWTNVHGENVSLPLHASSELNGRRAQHTDIDDISLGDTLTAVLGSRRVPLLHVEVLEAPADGCLVHELRRGTTDSVALTTEPFVLILRPTETGVPLKLVWGCGPPALAHCIPPRYTKVMDLFPLAIGKAAALRSLRDALLPGVELAVVERRLGETWLRVDTFDANPFA
jgi:hypothetical protein